MRTAFLGVAVLCACGPRAAATVATPSTVEVRHPGCFLVHDLRSGATRAWETQSCDDRTSPASTFKIPHALIGLETGVIAGVDAVRPWDEKAHPGAPWGREDQTLTTAIRQSVVWYFQEVGAEVGQERLAEYLGKLGYGNARVGEIAPVPFWLDGTLAISGREQLDFLRRLWAGQLPVSQRYVESVDAILEQPITALKPRVGDPDRFRDAWTSPARCAFKTGATVHGEGNVTWLVGLVRGADTDAVFVSRVVGEGPPGPRSPAVEAALVSLLALELL